ncbi:hypothetical protein NP233_g6255 [Leucocoprinus birnbaumii]|uniref:Uncharacterized protein n=1 Tax=Leucocoprinus birnbaumii TaxID=56174 RepID=A0AAD5VUV0_9AGAR|nr:hypothetical protein NP233_g6255 [Leucocoprinus birnbaumii]
MKLYLTQHYKFHVTRARTIPQLHVHHALCKSSNLQQRPNTRRVAVPTFCLPSSRSLIHTLPRLQASRDPVPSPKQWPNKLGSNPCAVMSGEHDAKHIFFGSQMPPPPINPLGYDDDAL